MRTLSRLHGPNEPVYTIGVAARLLAVSPSTLRLLEREGLVEPARTPKHTRLYSEADLIILKRICQMMRVDRVNLAGVKAILAVERRMWVVTSHHPIAERGVDDVVGTLGSVERPHEREAGHQPPLRRGR